MKYSIGDKIVLLRTGEEGHVTAYINKEMIEVEVNGTSFPVHMMEIDHPYLKWFTEKNKQQKKQKAVPEQLPVEKPAQQKRLAKGVYLSFLPVFKHDEFEDIVEHLKVHLLNELPTPVKFSYDVRTLHKSSFKHEGELHPFGNLYLHNISWDDMNDQPRFHWQLTDTSNKDNGIADGVLRIKPPKLFEQINELLKKNEPTFSYLLIDDFKPKKKIDKFDISLPPAPKPEVITRHNIHHAMEAAKYEIDLHIENLGGRRGLSNDEIIKKQLDTMQHYVHLAIVHRQQSMIIIHGLGKGKLREEVHAILKTIPEVARYKNEWSGRYGFGATEVWFKY